MNESGSIPCKEQIWEVIDDCNVQIQYLFTAPITFDCSVTLIAGERIRIMRTNTELWPKTVGFVPLRYDELHDNLVPLDMRETPRNKQYRLSVEAGYFHEHFKFIEDVS